MEHVTVPGKQLLSDYLNEKALMALGRKPIKSQTNIMTVLQRPLFSLFTLLLTPRGKRLKVEPTSVCYTINED